MLQSYLEMVISYNAGHPMYEANYATGWETRPSCFMESGRKGYTGRYSCPFILLLLPNATLYY